MQNDILDQLVILHNNRCTEVLSLFELIRDIGMDNLVNCLDLVGPVSGAHIQYVNNRLSLRSSSRVSLAAHIEKYYPDRS
jgi:hypothetical protein